VFLFQIGGPISLDVVEAATGESFRDMKHLRYRDSQICGHPVQICRVGMAGTLAYEVHGSIAHAHEIIIIIVMMAAIIQILVSFMSLSPSGLLWYMDSRA
jgi:glycine cleavage system aminomethyltransferase T